MTTTDSPSKFRYEGNGATDTFAFTGRIFAADDLIVDIILRADDSLVDTLTLTTDYSVTINSPSSASVVVTAPNIPSSLQDIQIRRALDKTQSLVLPTGTVFSAKSVETALDKNTAMIQELQETLDRTIKIPPQSSIDSLSITEAPVDGKALVYSTADGGYINGPDAADIAAAQENAEDAETARIAAEAAQAAAEAAAALLPLNKLNGTAAPTVNDDSGDGYSVSSKWYDLTNDEAYICLDATLGAAVWVLATLDTEDLGTAAFVDVIDEDSMVTDSATRPPSQQSTKAYVDNSITNFGVKLQTLVSVNSGTSVTLSSSIPAGVKRVIVNCDNISFTGSESLQLDLNSEVTGYVSGSNVFSATTAFALYTNAFRMRMATAAANGTYARFTLTLIDASTNKWYCEATGTNTVDSTCILTGIKALSGALTTLRLNGAGGGTFDGTGSASISWEF